MEGQDLSAGGGVLKNDADSELLASALASCLPLIPVVVASAYVGVFVVVLVVVVAKVVVARRNKQGNLRVVHSG